MLLDLFIADAERRRLTVKSICIASGAPMTTALRHLNWLVDNGYAVRLDHPHDGRSVRVQLGTAGREAMTGYLVSLAL